MPNPDISRKFFSRINFYNESPRRKRRGIKAEFRRSQIRRRNAMAG